MVGLVAVRKSRGAQKKAPGQYESQGGGGLRADGPGAKWFGRRGRASMLIYRNQPQQKSALDCIRAFRRLHYLRSDILVSR